MTSLLLLRLHPSLVLYGQGVWGLFLEAGKDKHEKEVTRTRTYWCKILLFFAQNKHAGVSLVRHGQWDTDAHILVDNNTVWKEPPKMFRKCRLTRARSTSEKSLKSTLSRKRTTYPMPIRMIRVFTSGEEMWPFGISFEFCSDDAGDI